MVKAQDNEVLEEKKVEEQVAESSNQELTENVQTEQKEEVGEAKEKDDFGKLLDESFIDMSKLKEGDVVQGEIINVNDSYIFISIGGKFDAYAEKIEYEDKNGNLKYKIGDQLKGFIVKKTDTDIVVSKSLTRNYVDRTALKEAFDQKIPVKGKITATVKGGFSVEILGVRAFCPLSQIDIIIPRDPAEFKGKKFDFEITEVNDNFRNIIVSRKALLSKELQEKKKEIMEKIQEGNVVKGVISRLTDFGAFIDLGGVDGLLHVSQISWARIEKPSDVLKIGEEVEVKIIKVDGDRISLSIKELTKNPLEETINELKEGEVVKCRVLRNEAFGSFVEIKPGVEGLIPISEMLLGRRVNNPSEVVEVGDLVEAQILKVNIPEKKISLSLKALEDDPWDKVEDIVKEGEEVQCKIESITNFGIFAKISDGLIGLVPKSKQLKSSKKYNESDIGNEVAFRVASVDKIRKRISLEPLDLPVEMENMSSGKDFMRPEKTERPPRQERRERRTKVEKEDWQKYARPNQEVPEDNPFLNL